jgi:hypothetical protein
VQVVRSSVPYSRIKALDKATVLFMRLFPRDLFLEKPASVWRDHVLELKAFELLFVGIGRTLIDVSEMPLHSLQEKEVSKS